MLILSRKIGERIHVGDDVVITLLQIDRNKCRIGIDAPRSVPVYREELLPLSPPSSAVPAGHLGECGATGRDAPAAGDGGN